MRMLEYVSIAPEIIASSRGFSIRSSYCDDPEG